MKFIVFALIVAIGAGVIYDKYSKGEISLDFLTDKAKEAGSEIIAGAGKVLKDVSENGIDTNKILEDNKELIDGAKNIANKSLEVLGNVNLADLNLPKLNITCEQAKSFAKVIRNKEGLSGDSSDEFFNVYNTLKSSGLSDKLIDKYIDYQFCNK